MITGDRVQLNGEEFVFGTVLRADDDAVSVKLDDGRAVAVRHDSVTLL